MDFPPLSPKQIAYLCDNYGLEAEKLERLLEDIWAFTAISPKAHALKRHGDLKAQGERNEAIYARVLTELEDGRFQTDELSQRQVRRMIYG